ncbi:hypothetical protein SISSUDRAFT_1057248 [Sistotremastrum suecicum HHB10207 ss-3]|uniref:Ubiquinol-cytochrome c chaperone domain-containing protein n=1 Tax=Sistotremastrum suecicum HHB10207 ss-3 TaxID=1314776 RepID=A0A166IFG8_9AGAM|nr:hypothetical protein SISSUDRAFT_1057248 [Sistotremastrum suecicum HHB10207 ss-3]
MLSRLSRASSRHLVLRRFLAASPSKHPHEQSQLPSSSTKYPKPYYHVERAPPPPSKITRTIEQNPTLRAVVLKLAALMGYNSPAQVAQRQALRIYQNAVRNVDDQERAFWHNECSLPPTFQTWFTVVNLHIWLLTVRLRALPPPHGTHYIQGLIDHFFEDVEDRIRTVLSKRAPDRLVTRHLKICRDQWQGLGLAFDYGLVTSDVEVAAAVWRNFLGARGALGLEGRGQVVNYAGLEKPTPEQLVRDPDADDGSGVRDFEGEERDKYVKFPELMWTVTAYIRREIARLEAIPDADIMANGEVGQFGRIIVREDTLPSEES